jgi:acyl-coenzyme A thioesterase PaaI-like protein
MSITATLALRFISLWPPLLFNGIRVTAISADSRAVDVRLGLYLWNRNLDGTQFGGNLFTMTDPFYPLMLQRNLGPDYIIWDQAAQIEFLSPGRGPVTACFRLTQDRITEIRTATASGEKYLPVFAIDILAADGSLVARATRTIYVRRKPGIELPARPA